MTYYYTIQLFYVDISHSHIITLLVSFTTCTPKLSPTHHEHTGISETRTPLNEYHLIEYTPLQDRSQQTPRFPWEYSHTGPSAGMQTNNVKQRFKRLQCMSPGGVGQVSWCEIPTMGYNPHLVYTRCVLKWRSFPFFLYAFCIRTRACTNFSACRRSRSNMVCRSSGSTTRLTIFETRQSASADEYRPLASYKSAWSIGRAGYSKDHEGKVNWKFGKRK
ncbi:hypothetical protein BDR03DRAFT_967273 [Suillus americanus]|nr:hypothetical protein BDR03DRAFT_967273 [Suillus americanus]